MRIGFVLLSAVLCSAAASAQTDDAPAPPSAVTTGFMHAIHATNDVATTLDFYTDVFGIASEVRPFTNPGVALLTDSPGATLRIAMLQLPGRGLNFELTEFGNVARTPAQPSIVDPGAPHMKIFVADLDPVLAALDRRAAPILTRSSAPVAVATANGRARAIFCRDPDGYLVEAIEVPGAATDGSNVVGAAMGLTVGDLDESLGFWRDRLGFAFAPPSALSTDATMLDLFGIKGNVSFRTVAGVVPGSNVRLELIEFRGAPSSPFDLRVPDPGASGMAIRVAAIETLLPALKAAGVRVVSKDQALVEWNATLRNVFVKDPNGLNVELVGTIEPR